VGRRKAAPRRLAAEAIFARSIPICCKPLTHPANSSARASGPLTHGTHLPQPVEVLYKTGDRVVNERLPAPGKRAREEIVSASALIEDPQLQGTRYSVIAKAGGGTLDTAIFVPSTRDKSPAKLGVDTLDP
jgi:hypothetical protein